MTKTLALTLLALSAASARAQPVEHPDAEAPAPATRIELAVQIVGDIDQRAVEGAIATELGVRVSGSTAFAPALGRLDVVIDGNAVHVAYEPAAGSSIERTIALPASPEERIELIAYVAANLVRDQASELLAALHVAPVAPTPIVAPVTPPVIAPAPAPRPVAVDVELAGTIGFVPPLAIDRLVGAHVIVGGGLHALIGATDGSRYVSISGLVDTQREFASGVQIAGLGAIAGRVDGIQIGGLAAVAGGRLRGIQIGGVASVADRVDGVQIAGVANVGGEVHGAQIGVVNVARRMHGLQLGVINVTDDGDDAYPIGLLNFSRTGGVAVDAWAESSRLTGLALRHGPRHIHNIWGLAWSPDHAHVLAGAGLGTTLRIADRVALDLDAMNWWTDVWDGKLGNLDQVRATLAIPLGPIDLIGGAAANVYVGHSMDESADFHPIAERSYTSGQTHVVTWPSVFAGVRLHAH